MGGRYLISGAQLGVLKVLLADAYVDEDEDSGKKELFDFICEIEENGFIGQSFFPLKNDIQEFYKFLIARKLTGATKI